MHANIQAICSGTFVIQTHMACHKKVEKRGKKGEEEEIVKTDFVC